MAGWSVFTRPSSSSGKPVTSSTVVTAMPAVAERRRGAAGGDDLPAELRQALGEGDDPPLVADRDQRARHDERSRSGLHGFGKRRRGGPPRRRPARRPAAAGAPPRARAPRAVGGVVRPGRAPGPGRGSRPRSYTSSTRWTVAPLSRAPLASTASCTWRPYMPAPAERRQQGGVHVHDAMAVAGDDGGGNELEVAGQDQQVHPVARPAASSQSAPSAGSDSTSAGTPCARARSSAPASARLLTPAPPAPGPPAPRARSSASRLLPRPETATATRIVMAGESNRRPRAGKC